MVRADVITLVGEDPTSHGLYDSFTPVERQVYAERKSVGLREAYQAISVGLHPEIIFHLELAEDYHNERRLVWNNTPYRIVRTYYNGDGVELICERWSGDV